MHKKQTVLHHIYRTNKNVDEKLQYCRDVYRHKVWCNSNETDSGAPESLGAPKMEQRQYYYENLPWVVLTMLSASQVSSLGQQIWAYMGYLHYLILDTLMSVLKRLFFPFSTFLSVRKELNSFFIANKSMRKRQMRCYSSQATVALALFVLKLVTFDLFTPKKVILKANALSKNILRRHHPAPMGKVLKRVLRQRQIEGMHQVY